GHELGFVLSYVALSGVSILASYWWLVLSGSIVILSSWTVLSYWPPARSQHRRWILRQVVVFLNRQAEHFESLLAPITMFIIVPSPVRLPIQLGLVASVVLMGPLLVNLAAFVLQGVLAQPGSFPIRLKDLLEGNRCRRAIAYAQLLWMRRPILYFATLGSLAVIVSRAWDQLRAIVPLVFIIAGAIAWRFLIWLHWRRSRSDHARSRFRVRAAVWARRLDGLVLALAAVIALVVPFRALRGQLRNHDSTDRQVNWSDCQTTQTGSADVAVFLVADTQLHELGGEPSAVQLPMLDALVPVAARPIEQDLLSESTLRHFGAIFTALKKQRSDLQWAHLGDFGDAGCIGELARFGEAMADFGSERTLLALVPGNHDSAFEGNFSWHPDWDRVCKHNGLAHKADSDRKLIEISASRLAANAQRPTAGFASLPTVSRLGTLKNPDTPVLGVFVDTADYSGATLGAAGVQGGVSAAQARWIRGVLSAQPKAAIVLFLHHPYDSIAPSGQDELERVVTEHGNLLAVVSAHTHLASLRTESTRVPELVIGSTTDPPQEAALLELTRARTGEPVQVHLRTIPSVARLDPELTCGVATPGQVTADDCEQAFKRLPENDCRALFHDPTLTQLTRKTRADDPSWVQDNRRDRGRQLLACLCGQEPGCRSTDPLDDEHVFERLRDAYGREPKALVCLSWAAAVLQAHKHQGWGLDRALAHALDPLSTFGAMDRTELVSPQSALRR
ncbi:MAG TPA: metallophosphoesterase, partial [Polyangia bacterium]|nr:metallophosphoesterase [Polyangia bacterium]